VANALSVGGTFRDDGPRPQLGFNLVDVKRVEFFVELELGRRNRNHPLRGPTLDHRIHDGSVDGFAWQGTCRLAGIIGARGNLGDVSKRLFTCA
jgi:hypothetical protein